MYLLPPSPKPFGVFAEKSVVPLAAWEKDLAIAKEVERQIKQAAIHHLVDEMLNNLDRAGLLRSLVLPEPWSTSI